jgi:L-2-hydroxyglutarate oxidase LhgO
MSTDYHTIVVGAGVVGLAVAAEMASRGPLLVIEKEWKFGQSTSSHNSEVVHAGLYYDSGSLKARLCAEGNRMIRRLAADHGIGLKQVGKYIVAVNDDERAYLQWLKANAEANGVTDLRWVTPAELREHEPSVKSVAALFSPTSSIVDSHALMVHFKTQAELSGTDFAFNAEVMALKCLPATHRGTSAIWEVTIRDSDGTATTLTSASVVNSAGLHSDEVAAMAGLDVRALDLNLLWTRGFYYTLEDSAKLEIHHLVYPVPDKSLKSLGVHATIDLAGGLRFGPTAEYMNQKVEDYSFADAETVRVAESISRYLPEVAPDRLSPMMTGIRPKLTRPNQPPRDFYIREESDHGLPGLVNLIGIESPGLTASPAIARLVATMI